MLNPASLIVFGVIVGIFSGLMGLGGGSLVIPIMVLLMGFSQAKAHGMSLMVMCIPVMLPAVIGYFQKGALTRTDIWTAAFIALGFALGSFSGSQLAFLVDRYKGGLQITFGLLLIYVAGFTAFGGKEHPLRSVILSTIVMLIAGAMVIGVKWSDKSAAAGQTPAPTAPAT